MQKLVQKRFKTILARAIGYLLVICFAFFVGLKSNGNGILIFEAMLAAHATAESAIPSGWESYLGRPDILRIQAQEKELGSNWEAMRAAHFSFVAELLEMYSENTHLYFLARDSEFLYDVAKLVTDGTPRAEQIHLLNVSRGNMRDPNLKSYLKENGISNETLKSGKKVLFVDTGYSGTISGVIGENYPELSSKLKTQLIISSTSSHPSSRAFLVHLNPSVNNEGVSDMHGSIISYEQMPRYTDRSTRIVFANGHYHPISPTGKEMDGSVSKKQSLEFMKDIKAWWQKSEVRQRFADESRRLRTLKSALIEGSEASKEAIKAEFSQLKNTDEGFLFEAQIRDALELQTNASLSLKVTLADLGLEPNVYRLTAFSKKKDLIKKYPEWTPVLENPDHEIPKLFATQNWQMIGNLIEANVDAEINGLIAKSLYDAPAIGIKKNYQILMIEKADSKTLESLAAYTFSQSHAQPAEYQVLRKSLSIKDPNRRKEWLEANLLKIKSPVAKKPNRSSLKCSSVFESM